MPRFRLLKGRHCEGQKDPVSGKLLNYKPGDVFDSPFNLEAKNSQFSKKFERVSESLEPGYYPFPEGYVPSNTKKLPYRSADLDLMSLEHLKQLALQEGLNPNAGIKDLTEVDVNNPNLDLSMFKQNLESTRKKHLINMLLGLEKRK